MEVCEFCGSGHCLRASPDRCRHTGMTREVPSEEEGTEPQILTNSPALSQVEPTTQPKKRRQRSNASY